MSELKVEVVEIRDVVNHPNADRLDIAMISGWACIVGRGQFRAGDHAVYIPIDALLSEATESIIFADSKIKLHNHRVRTIKLRGQISQGLLVDFKKFPDLADLPVGTDVAYELGITKFEPPEPEFQSFGAPGQPGKKRKQNPLFHKYTDISNIKHYHDTLREGEPVVMTCKIHGTSARFGCLPTATDTIWKKIKKFLHLLPEFETVYGSRNVQLQNRIVKGHTYYKKDVYYETLIKYSLESKLCPHEVVYGEIYGGGIQKNYTYDCGPEERRFVVYDVEDKGRWLNHDELVLWCSHRGLPMVPILYEGPFSQEALDAATNGPSVLAPSQKVREGCVVRPVEERMGTCGRVVLKSVSPDYLLDLDNSDFH